MNGSIVRNKINNIDLENRSNFYFNADFNVDGCVVEKGRFPDFEGIIMSKNISPRV